VLATCLKVGARRNKNTSTNTDPKQSMKWQSSGWGVMEVFVKQSNVSDAHVFH